jgi:5-methylcytosine-specific restriction protein A
LGTSLWRADLYEAGNICSIRYTIEALPDEETLVDDLTGAIALYGELRQSVGWQAEDAIILEANEADQGKSLKQAKRYVQHRSIERQPSHSRAVKKAQGYRCKGCDKLLVDKYGDVASDLIDAHHLTPLSSLDEGEIVSFDPVDDFAVLCPNCHRVIHRLEDPSDLEALRILIETARRAWVLIGRQSS